MESNSLDKSGTPGTLRLAFAALAIVGIAIFAAGIFYFPNNPIPLVLGVILFCIGLNLSIASAYKAATGRDATGSRFWKRAFRIQDKSD